MNHIWVKPINNKELNVYQYGYEKCEPKYIYGPYVRDHYLIHIVTNGKGTFALGNITYKLSQGQGFIIFPDEITYYEADELEPWTYFWIGFNGGNVSTILDDLKFSKDNPVFNIDNIEKTVSVFKNMENVDVMTKKGQLKLTGYLYMILAEMNVNGEIKKSSYYNPYSTSKEYVSKAIEYIQKNYSVKISVNDISKYIGLNRSYFGAIFKKHTSMSPQEFIMKFRLQKAIELMENEKLNISDISRSVGYEDAMLFCKIFKKEYGLPPSKYRVEKI